MGTGSEGWRDVLSSLPLLTAHIARSAFIPLVRLQIAYPAVQRALDSRFIPFCPTGRIKALLATQLLRFWRCGP